MCAFPWEDLDFGGGSLYCWSVPRSRTLSLSLSVHTYMYTYIYTYIHTYIPHLAALSLFCSFKYAQPLFRSPKRLAACQAAMLDVYPLFQMPIHSFKRDMAHL